MDMITFMLSHSSCQTSAGTIPGVLVVCVLAAVEAAVLVAAVLLRNSVSVVTPPTAWRKGLFPTSTLCPYNNVGAGIPYGHVKLGGSIIIRSPS